MKFTSDLVIVEKPASQIYKFLSNFKNFEHLMPEQVTNWQATELTCSFTVEKMADIAMNIHKTEVDSKIHVKSAGKVPFEFDLICILEPVSKTKTKAHIELNADLNPFMAMMAKRPLQNLVNIMVEKLKKHHDDSKGGQEK